VNNWLEICEDHWSQHIPEWTKQTKKYLIQKCRCLRQDSKRKISEYKLRTLTRYLN